MNKFLLIFVFLISIPFIVTYVAKFKNHSLEAVYMQTGVRFPEKTKLLHTEANAVTLADGPNYSWQLYSDEPLLEWVKTNAGSQQNGWHHVKGFQHVSLYYDKKFKALKLHGVWGLWKNIDKREETSYIYLSSDFKNAVLHTFRP